MKQSSSIIRELLTIIVSSVFLALVYNTFSPKGLPLIRVEPKKIAASDSALFPSQPSQSPSDTSIQHQVKVIAPLHERALKNPDSMAAVVKQEQEKREEIVKVVTLNQVKRLLDQGRGLFIDARDTAAYRKGHIKDARNIFGDAPDQHFEELVQIPRDTLIVIYCNNPECHLGRVLAEFMSVMGFKNLYLYDDGWDGWEQAKMPVDTSTVME